jgi:hypothetical protein
MRFPPLANGLLERCRLNFTRLEQGAERQGSMPLRALIDAIFAPYLDSDVPDHSQRLTVVGPDVLVQQTSITSQCGLVQPAEPQHGPDPVLDVEVCPPIFALRSKADNLQHASMSLLKRLTLIIDDSEVVYVFYPVFPPDRSASDVINWLAMSLTSLELTFQPRVRRQSPDYSAMAAQHWNCKWEIPALPAKRPSPGR